MKKTIITGIRATGIPHIGNYLGAMKPVLKLQNEYSLFHLVADLHALPHVKDPAVLNENVRTVTACCLACGLDTNKTVIWRQSQMIEMAWIVSILSAFTTVNELDILMDRQNNNDMDMISYMYPVLMAADTLMLNTDYVYAGVDHKEGMAFIKKLASNFNKYYGESFRLPESMFPPLSKMVKGIDGRKMSKSFNNTITILETEENLHEIIMNPKLYQTTSEKDEMETVLELLALFISEDEFTQIKQEFMNNEMDSKEVRYKLFTSMNKELAPIRQKYDEIIKKPDYIDNILNDGLAKVKVHTAEKTAKIMQKVGFR